EAAERGAEGECADRAEPERLHAELMERAGVDEPAAPGGEIRRERGNGEEARGERPPDAREAVYRHRTDRVVDSDALDERDRDDGDRGGDDADHDRGPGGDEPGAR